MRPRTRTFITLALTSTFALALGACSMGGGVDRDEAQQVHLVASLTPVSSCDDLLHHLQREAMDRVGPYGLGGGDVVVDDFGPAEGDAASGVAPPSPSGAEDQAASSFSGPALPGSPRDTE